MLESPFAQVHLVPGEEVIIPSMGPSSNEETSSLPPSVPTSVNELPLPLVFPAATPPTPQIIESIESIPTTTVVNNDTFNSSFFDRFLPKRFFRCV